MSWYLTLWKGIKYALIGALAYGLSYFTPDVLSKILESLPFHLGNMLVPVLTGAIAALINLVKHWNDPVV